jgi:hypothetical protein
VVRSNIVEESAVSIFTVGKINGTQELKVHQRIVTIRYGNKKEPSFQPLNLGYPYNYKMTVHCTQVILYLPTNFKD